MFISETHFQLFLCPTLCLRYIDMVIASQPFDSSFGPLSCLYLPKKYNEMVSRKSCYPGVRITMQISSVPLLFQFARIIKTIFAFLSPCSYLSTVVTP